MSDPVLYLARASALDVAEDGSIQMFPPGKHAIVPSNADPKKKSQVLELIIDAATADVVESARAAYQAKADAGEGDAPYFDFNHNDEEASFWPKRIFWGGDDPKLGGVRAEGERSAAGEQAISGKTFRRFSPAFYEKDGRITGAPTNMGGLVNRAAFTKVAALFAKSGETETSPESETAPTMLTPEEITALQQENTRLTTVVTGLETRVGEMEVAAKAAAETDAKNFVAIHAKEGRIPPAVEIQAKWVAAIIADPAAKDLILAMAVNPALKQIIKAKAAPEQEGEEEVVEAKSGIDGLAAAIKAKREAAATAHHG
ncbi:MAG: hypothetical protein ABIS50_15145 [Luteolibacter sp.]|uniref:hypothetical protein n=1 Tax=Luteolibacter sp. TaxID=1962973 RepID=UPI0032657B5A